MALAFAKAGANIILNGRGEIPKEKIEEIEAFGVKCVGVSGDISDYESGTNDQRSRRKAWIDPCVSKQCRNHK